MIKNKKALIYLILISLLIVLFYSFLMKKEKSSKEIEISLQDFILGSFLNELPGINEKLPHKIDNLTTLISIQYENKKILSIYELTSYSISSELLDKIKPPIKKQACEDEMRQKLLGADIEFLDRYKNRIGDILFEVTTNKQECIKI